MRAIFNKRMATAVLSALGVPIYQKDITSRVGGTAADLDSIVTLGAAMPVDSVITFNDSDNGGAYETWVLASSTAAEDAVGGVVRPDDYAGTTNEKVWFLQG